MRLPGSRSLWASAVLAGGLCAASLLHPTGLGRLRGVERDVARYQAENEALRRENERLRREIELLGTEGYLERIIREELQYLRPDELLFQIR